MLPQTAHKAFWMLATALGPRRITLFLTRNAGRNYGSTVFWFDCEKNEKYIALTIDDGLCRNGFSASLVPEVMDLLNKYNSRATFFVCSKYTSEDPMLATQAKMLVDDCGCELGNHMNEDLSGYYSRLSSEEFRNELDSANRALDSIENNCERKKTNAIRWFRAPQGIYTTTMRGEVEAESAHPEQNDRPYRRMVHALGDCFCDDWKISDANFVSRTMLKQIHPGSIAVLHMPEKGFRESGLRTMDLFLRGLSDMGYKCVTLTEMHDMFNAQTGSGLNDLKSPNMQ